MVSTGSGSPSLQFIYPLAVLFSLFITKMLTPSYQCPPPRPPPTQIVCTLAGLLLFSYFHLNLIELILYGVTFNIALLIKYTSKNSSYIAIKSSCYSSETQHLLKFANRDKSLTEVLQSVRKLEDKINFSNKQVKKIDVFLIAIPRMGFNCF